MSTPAPDGERARAPSCKRLGKRVPLGSVVSRGCDLATRSIEDASCAPRTSPRRAKLSLVAPSAARPLIEPSAPWRGPASLDAELVGVVTAFTVGLDAATLGTACLADCAVKPHGPPSARPGGAGACCSCWALLFAPSSGKTSRSTAAAPRPLGREGARESGRAERAPILWRRAASSLDTPSDAAISRSVSATLSGRRPSGSARETDILADSTTSVGRSFDIEAEFGKPSHVACPPVAASRTSRAINSSPLPLYTVEVLLIDGGDATLIGLDRAGHQLIGLEQPLVALSCETRSTDDVAPLVRDNAQRGGLGATRRCSCGTRSTDDVAPLVRDSAPRGGLGATRRCSCGMRSTDDVAPLVRDNAPRGGLGATGRWSA
eukprot:scaffold7125_cov118-Isochrysis_galbana.AAC.9